MIYKFNFYFSETPLYCGALSYKFCVLYLHSALSIPDTVTGVRISANKNFAVLTVIFNTVEPRSIVFQGGGETKWWMWEND
jgi:hypothetical protein